MKKNVTITARVDVTGNITLCYNMGSWCFGRYVCAANRFYANIQLPRYTKTIDCNTEIVLETPPTKVGAFHIYKSIYEREMSMFKTERLDYWQSRLKGLKVSFE